MATEIVSIETPAASMDYYVPPTALEERARSRSSHLDKLANQQLNGNGRERTQLIRQHIFHQPQGNESWKLFPETPTGVEIMVRQEDCEALLENRPSTVWPSKNKYLETQYRLIRREGTEALRFVLNNYKTRLTPDDDKDICIYRKVHVRGYTLTRMGAMCRVSFSTEHAKKKINWLQSRRLMPGTIVALSPKSDDFRSVCIVATVAQRPYRNGLDKNPPEVDIIWGDLDQAVIDPDMELIMIEARVGYYEAVRHTLIGLQMASEYESPIDKYVLGQERDDHLASFLDDKPFWDLTSILSPAADATCRDFVRAYDVRGPVPDILEHSTMDETQLHALYRMITKELCIVQGPPGTGKTFTSVEALKVSLANQRKNDPPIIIAAQTNHALDQLLDLCLNMGARIVRIGGRTESERIGQHTMYEVKKKLGPGQDNVGRMLEADRRQFNQDISGLANTLFNDVLLEPHDLLATEILTSKQYASLVDEATDRTSTLVNDGPFALWLSGEFVETDVLRNKYSEQDLLDDDEEFNQDEYEFEGDDVENIAADEEDDDRIRGHWLPLVYRWAGKLPPGQQNNWRKRAEKELKKQDLFQVPKNLRGAVYQLLYERYIAEVRPRFIKHFKQYGQICHELKANRWDQEAAMVGALRLNIVGCTTTGLTKYRGLLAALGAKTLVIEEAAETREANIVSALYPSIQQLILVGDHQQLTPFSNVRWLGQDPYYLDLSMFERLVEWVCLPYVMLDKQRRMAPEIRAVVDTFYDGLDDHPVALTRKPVPGMGDKHSWLFTHAWEDSTDANHSRYNSEEANMIVNFFAYLVNNGMAPDNITVLTYYMAQRRMILKRLRQHPSIIAASFHVHTVDSYQGEENDVVLLSMVRSPPAHAEHAVGFLDSKNRAIVAISRARRGFYVFGNIMNAVRATKQSGEIWGPISDAFAKQGRIDTTRGLPLQCQPHGKVIWVKHAWPADNAGGCNERCTFVRHCGHQCTFPCHVKSHDQIRCSQMCGKTLLCGHKCQIWCKDPCNCVCEAFLSVKKVARTRKVQDEARMHMDLEEILRLEAGILAPGAQPTPGPVQPLISVVQAPVRTMPAGNAYSNAPHAIPDQGRVSRNIMAGGHMPPMNPPPTQRPYPQMRYPPGVAAQVPQMRSPLAVGAQPAVNSYRTLADNIASHDQAHASTHQAGQAGGARVQPIIHDNYTPTAVVDGQRVNLLRGSGSLPQKVVKPASTVKADSTARSDVATGTPAPEPVGEKVDFREMSIKEQWEMASILSEADTERLFSSSMPFPRRDTSFRGIHDSSANSTTNVDDLFSSAFPNAGRAGIIDESQQRASSSTADLLESSKDLGNIRMPPLFTMPPAQPFVPLIYGGDLNNWMERLSVGAPPESATTRPSSTDAFEFGRTILSIDSPLSYSQYSDSLSGNAQPGNAQPGYAQTIHTQSGPAQSDPAQPAPAQPAHTQAGNVQSGYAQPSLLD